MHDSTPQSPHWAYLLKAPYENSVSNANVCHHPQDQTKALLLLQCIEFDLFSLYYYAIKAESVCIESFHISSYDNHILMASFRREILRRSVITVE